MGSGAAFLDYDGDGDQDILLVNSDRWTHSGSTPSPRPTPGLFRNDGHGRFEDVTAHAGLDVTCFGMGVAVADYDNDDDPDVFITALGGGHLFRNDGGTFRDVTGAALAARVDGWLTAPRSSIWRTTGPSTSSSADTSTGRPKSTVPRPPSWRERGRGPPTTHRQRIMVPTASSFATTAAYSST